VPSEQAFGADSKPANESKQLVGRENAEKIWDCYLGKRRSTSANVNMKIAKRLALVQKRTAVLVDSGGSGIFMALRRRVAYSFIAQLRP
jgi:hypothetical protein